ncbi:hypothetical protein D3C72_1529420 [compost metagenome]
MSTRSPAARPSITCQRVPMARPMRMGRFWTLSSASITSVEALPSGARVTACCGTSSAASFTPSCSTARTYMPGISSLSGLGTTARRVTLPVPASTVTPLKVRRPACG